LVLEALRPIWDRISDVVLELQPAAWKHANVSLDSGLSTLSQLIGANHYTIVALPHSNQLEGARDQKHVMLPPAACELLVSRESFPKTTRSVGWAHARVLSTEQFQDRVRTSARRPAVHGYFNEFWLAPPWRARQCRHAQATNSRN
jgi:hypothetical protein